MNEELKALSGRREILFLYDIKMGNPNGDPDENRPRVLPDGTYYVTDVRLKRFCRDFLKNRGLDILVDNIEGRTTNLTGRVVHYLNKKGLDRAEGRKLVDILLESFIDARLFGSSLAFKAEKIKDDKGKEVSWEPKPEPKTLTGPVQFNMGEVLHRAESVDIFGTTTFGSDDTKTQGTFTNYFGLRYGLIGFSGVANEHSAKKSRMTDDDYELLLKSIWQGVRSSANTRSKVGQIPHLLVSIEYNHGNEFQFGRLHDYIQPMASADKEEKEWSSPADYNVDINKLLTRLAEQKDRIQRIRFVKSADLQLSQEIPADWVALDIDNMNRAAEQI